MKQFSLVNIDEEIEKFDTIADDFTKLPLYLTGLYEERGRNGGETGAAAKKRYFLSSSTIF